jgi:hypothetical protein
VLGTSRLGLDTPCVVPAVVAAAANV